MDADLHPPTDARTPSTVALAVLITLSMLAILLLGWVWYTRYAPVHYDLGPNASITDAEHARFIIPILLAGGVLVALIWVVTWLVARWKITVLPIAIGALGLVALIFFAIELQDSIDASQPITIVTVQCESGAVRPQGRFDELPAGCDEIGGQRSATIGTSGDPDMYVSEPNSAHHVLGLPRGIYSSLLTVQGQPETATAILATETSNGILPVSPLQHQQGTTWSGALTTHPNLTTYYLLLYPSPYEAVPDASIRFNVHQCSGTSLASFDPAACSLAPLASPVIQEVPDPNAERGRPTETTLDGSTVLMTNLEARPYTFEPAVIGDAFTPAGQDVLVIAADDPQASERNILTPDAATPHGTFTIDVTPHTVQLTYNVYIVQRGPTIAAIDHPSGATDVRPYPYG